MARVDVTDRSVRGRSHAHANTACKQFIADSSCKIIELNAKTTRLLPATNDEKSLFLPSALLNCFPFFLSSCNTFSQTKSKSMTFTIERLFVKAGKSLRFLLKTEKRQEGRAQASITCDIICKVNLIVFTMFLPTDSRPREKNNSGVFGGKLTFCTCHVSARKYEKSSFSLERCENTRES